MKRWLKQPSVITRKAGNSNARAILVVPGSGFKVPGSGFRVPSSGEQDAIEQAFELFGAFG